MIQRGSPPLAGGPPPAISLGSSRVGDRDLGLRRVPSRVPTSEFVRRKLCIGGRPLKLTARRGVHTGGHGKTTRGPPELCSRRPNCRNRGPSLGPVGEQE